MINSKILKTTLYEASRNQAIQKSKSGDNYSPLNRMYGRNRYQRRLRQKVSKSVAEYNKLDMNKLFTNDILDVNVEVKGETDSYLVRISFSGVVSNIKKQLNGDIRPLDIRLIMKALTASFNSNDVYFNCSCPDFKYRHRYWASRNNLVVGTTEDRPSKITNPHDTKGGCCKHVSMVLTNNSWLLKVASVIKNYVKYMETNYANLYQSIIFPAIYDLPFNDISDEEKELVLPSTEKDISDINASVADKRDEKGRFISGNKYQAKSSNNSDSISDNEIIIDNPDNKSFDFNS